MNSTSWACIPTRFDCCFCCNKWVYVMMLNYVTWFMVMYRWILNEIFKEIKHVIYGILIQMLRLQVLQQSRDKDHMDGHDIHLIIINVVLFMWNIFNVICYMITDLERSQMDQLILEMNASIFFIEIYT